MYYAHFGLSEPPFRITPNTEVFFGGANRAAILEALIYAISQGEGIIKVTGEVGTGKTMLCNMLQSRLPANIETVYLAHPSVSPDEILQAIAFELQLKVARDASRMEVMQALYGYLLERHALNKQVVIFVEESQNMPIATLEEVRLLSNLETGKHKLLQIVLFGQPELDDNLRQPHIRQLRERITHSFSLPPLSPQEVGEYLMFRLRAVGYRGPDLFSTGVVKRIAQASAGLTRRINLIADKALLAAFSESTHTVQPKHVAAAIRDSEFARDSSAHYADNRRWLWVGAVALSLAVALAVYFGVRQLQAGLASSPHAAPEPAAVGGGPPASAEHALNAAHAPPGGEALEGARPPLATPSSPVAPPAEAKSAEPSRAAVAVTATVVAKPQQTLPAASAEGAETPAASRQEDIANQGDMLSERLQATIRWLESQPPDTVTIQLLAAENADLLREHLSTIAKSIEAANIYVYRTIARQRPFLAVLYGSFDSRETAQRALERLPPPLKAFKPYVRTVQGIREEMSRHRTL